MPPGRPRTGVSTPARRVLNKSILARIPNPNAGPAFYMTASEGAAIIFVSLLHTTIMKGPQWLILSQGSRCLLNTLPENNRMEPECHSLKSGRVGIYLNKRGVRGTVTHRMVQIELRSKTYYYERGCYNRDEDAINLFFYRTSSILSRYFYILTLALLAIGVYTLRRTEWRIQCQHG